MRVLVTRAEPNATRTAATLRSLGHEPVVLPLSRAIHTPETAERTLLQSSGPIVVTSAEALRALSEIELPQTSWRDRVLYAVGAATGKVAYSLGFRRVVTGEGNALSLANRIAADLSSATGHFTAQDRLLYLAGTPRTTSLEAELARLGVVLETCEIYRMEDVIPPLQEQEEALVIQDPEAVLCYSSESLRRLLDLPLLLERTGVLKEARFCCMSEAVASILPSRFRKSAQIASAMSEPELLALL